MAILPIEPADRQALAIGAAVRILSGEEQGIPFTELLPFRKAWPLAVLLSTWYLLKSRREPESAPGIVDWREKSSGVRVIHNMFDTYQNFLEPAAKAAYDAKESWDYAGAGALFAFAAKSIKLPYLQVALSHPVFEEATSAVSVAAPAPADLEFRYARELGQRSPERPAAAPPSQPAPAPQPATPRTNLATPTSSEVAPSSEADQTEVDMCSIYMRGQLGITNDGTIAKLCAGPARVPFLIIAGLNVHLGMQRDFKQFVLNAPEIQRELEKFIIIHYDVAEERDPIAFRSLKITAFPTFIVSLKQQERGRLVGYANHDRFVQWLASLQLPLSSDRNNPQVMVSAEEQPLVTSAPAPIRRGEPAPTQTPDSASSGTQPIAQGSPASQDVVNLFAALQSGDLSPSVAEGYRQTLRNLGYLV